METNKEERQLDDTDIAVALMKGGLSWSATVAVMSRIKFDKSAWDGSNVVKP